MTHLVASTLRRLAWPTALLAAFALTACDRRPSPEVPAPPRTDSSPTPDTSPLTPPSQPASPASAA